MPKGKKGTPTKTTSRRSNGKLSETKAADERTHQSRSKSPGNGSLRTTVNLCQNHEFGHTLKQKQNLPKVVDKLVRVVSKVAPERPVNDLEGVSQIEKHNHDTRFKKNLYKHNFAENANVVNVNVEQEMETVTPVPEGLGDDIVVSVHAPEHDEFESEDDDRYRTSHNDSHSYQQRLESMRQDPIFKEMVNQAVAEQMRIERRERQNEREAHAKSLTSKPGGELTGGDVEIVQGALTNQSNEQIGVNINNSRMQTPIRPSRVINGGATNKSPSDTTIYAPAFAKVPDQQIQEGELVHSNYSPVVNKITEFLKQMRIDNVNREPGDSIVEGIRVNGDDNIGHDRDRFTTNTEPNPGTSRDNVNMQGQGQGDGMAGQAGAIMAKMVVDAENYRATLDQPPGTVHGQFSPNQNFSADDEFLHITCHVDGPLKQKIERGEFIELEKLLPKDPTKKLTNDGRMELVNRDGYTYFVPAADKDKINGVRKWEQAFRVYAAIYSKANPHRASEIWQYVYTINLAASSYIWENVACYDYTFRHLMSNNPSRSWAIIYHQMWSLAMRDPVQRANGSFHSRSGHGQGDTGGRNTSRDNYCWKFNKNKCRFGSRCRYEHRCNYCDGFGHGVFNCSRKSKSKERRHEKFDSNRNLDDNHHKGQQN